MAKLVVLLSAFALLLLLANASTYRATVEVGENSSRGQSCQEQFEQQQRFRHCQRYVQQEIQGEKELQELDRWCRCQNLEQILTHQQQQGQFRGEEVQELYETASELPSMCNISTQPGLSIPFTLLV
ncbi:hypothetical protein Patl1_02137 [Pistacia atlantica]|uniref:Uncharacterized protein n=1 Tax=Pistacia atlantica TaxID=434234 RepID=A0ACC1C6G7_9ROSI|nr:hypothetical protein Patl1_02137 [Pistacia atlantica]